MAGYMDKTDNINENNINNGAVLDSSGYQKPTSLFGALGVIQRYFVIESRAAEDLADEYFTIEQSFDFIKVGFKSGFIESFIFLTLFPFFENIYPSIKLYFFGEKINQYEYWGLIVLSYISIVTTTIFLMWLSKYYRGNLTKKALFSLFTGRSISFVIKGVIVYYALIYLAKLSYTSPDIVYEWVDFTKWLFDWFLSVPVTADDIYTYYYKLVIPALHQTATSILVTMIVMAMLPYLTIFLKGLINTKKKLDNQEAYEKY
jgi:hypothetical protein